MFDSFLERLLLDRCCDLQRPLHIVVIDSRDGVNVYRTAADGTPSSIAYSALVDDAFLPPIRVVVVDRDGEVVAATFHGVN
jgi:hypothetical protein